MILGVYCGTAFGDDPAYLEAARAVGRSCAEQGIDIVYGGAHVGLMGAVADAALAAGGRVTGVITRLLKDREVAHTGLTELHIVETMAERKALMSQLSTAFVALPGGPGTLDETVEQWTLSLLGIHSKPVGFLNVKGYYEPLRTMAARMVEQGFSRAIYVDMLVFADDPAELIARFKAYTPPPPKWE